MRRGRRIGRSVWAVLLIALMGAIALAGCGTDALLKDAYTAAGDGVSAKEVTRTAVFAHDDDLNVVIILNPHRRTLKLEALFTAPDGGVFRTDTLEADATVGQALLGLDWEARGGLSWPEGEWQVQVLIDGDVVGTERFTVRPAPVVPGPTPAS